MADADFPRRRSKAPAVDALNATPPAAVAARLEAAVEAIDGRKVFTTSFGIEDQLIAHFILSERLPVEVVTLDTGRLFPETYKVWQETEERYGVRIRAFFANTDAVEALVADQGINGFYYSKDARLACCELRKVEPLGRALSGAAGWITGLRAGQSTNRAETAFAEWDSERQLTKIAPLFDFKRAQVVAECVKLGIPINELHAQGFLSIGCAPCTRAVKPAEPERAGRWWWETSDAKECGLHVDGSGRLIRSAAA